jgi:hypothetical protein
MRFIVKSDQRRFSNDKQEIEMLICEIRFISEGKWLIESPCFSKRAVCGETMPRWHILAVQPCQHINQWGGRKDGSPTARPTYRESFQLY